MEESHLPALLRKALQAGSGVYLNIKKVMLYYTYVLQSQDGKLYIGFTEDLSKRLQEHELGKVTSTKYRRPLTLIYFEACLNRKSAILREKQLKTGYGRAYLKRRLQTGGVA